MPGGRPSAYSTDVTAKICDRLSQGESLRSICADDDMPHRATVFKWLMEHKEFSDQYARAKDEGADALVEEILEIADDGTNDWMEKLDKDGKPIGWVLNGEHVQRSRLRADVRKWYASKILPKKYGDKLDVTSGGERLERPPLIVSDIKPRNTDDDS